MKSSFRYIYGPVLSWRLGKSLGVDPLSDQKKICNLDCHYCQLGNTAQLSTVRREYVSVPDVMDEIQQVSPFLADHITFSGRGEPTLAKNLGDMIRAVKLIRPEKVAVITNSSLLNRGDVQDDLMSADFVLAKLDAINQEMFEAIDGDCGIDFAAILKGLEQFRARYQGRFALQMMLVEENIDFVKELGILAQRLNPHEIQLNTPIRPSGKAPLTREQIAMAKHVFQGMPVITCYDAPIEETVPFNEPATVARHGNYRKSRSNP